MAFYAYVLYSKNSGRFYKGHCEHLEKRIIEHNSGKTKSIKPFIPWDLVYYEDFFTRHEAIARERYFKSAAGRSKEYYKTLDTSSMPERNVRYWRACPTKKLQSIG